MPELWEGDRVILVSEPRFNGGDVPAYYSNRPSDYQQGQTYGTITRATPDSDGDIQVNWDVDNFDGCYIHVDCIRPLPAPDLSSLDAVERFLNYTYEGVAGTAGCSSTELNPETIDAYLRGDAP